MVFVSSSRATERGGVMSVAPQKGQGLVFSKGAWGPVCEAMQEDRVSRWVLRGGGGRSPAVGPPGSA